MKCSKCRKFICCCCAHEVEDKPKPKPEPTPNRPHYGRTLHDTVSVHDRPMTLREVREFVYRTEDFPEDTHVKVSTYTSVYSTSSSLSVTHETEARYQ